jgi:hypothetical protein
MISRSSNQKAITMHKPFTDKECKAILVEPWAALGNAAQNAAFLSRNVRPACGVRIDKCFGGHYL